MHDQRPFRTLNISNEYKRESSATKVRPNPHSYDVFEYLTRLFSTTDPLVILFQIAVLNLMQGMRVNSCMILMPPLYLSS